MKIFMNMLNAFSRLGTSYRGTYEKGIYPTSAAEDLDIIPTFEESALSGLFPEGEPNSDDEEACVGLDDALLPPNTRRQSGRPRERRIRNSAVDITAKKRVYKCRSCKGPRHSKRTCVGPIAGN
jgi:hypothetical protein